MKPSSAGTRHPPALFTNVVTARASADGPANAVSADEEAHLYIAALPGATKATLERELRGRLRDGEYDLSVEEPEGGLTSPLGTALHRRSRRSSHSATLKHGSCPRSATASATATAHATLWIRRLRLHPLPLRQALVNLETKHGERIRTEDLEFELAAAVYIARNLPRMNDGRPAREVRATRHDSIPRDS